MVVSVATSGRRMMAIPSISALAPATVSSGASAARIPQPASRMMMSSAIATAERSAGASVEPGADRRTIVCRGRSCRSVRRRGAGLPEVDCRRLAVVPAASGRSAGR